MKLALGWYRADRETIINLYNPNVINYYWLENIDKNIISQIFFMNPNDSGYIYPAHPTVKYYKLFINNGSQTFYNLQKCKRAAVEELMQNGFVFPDKKLLTML